MCVLKQAKPAPAHLLWLLLMLIVDGEYYSNNKISLIMSQSTYIITKYRKLILQKKHQF